MRQSCGFSTGGENNLPQTTPNHQTSMNCTCYAKNQASKLKCLHILLSGLILEQGDRKTATFWFPLRSPKEGHEGQNTVFFLFFSTVLNYLIENVSSWTLMPGSWHARGFVTCFYSNWKKYPSVAISFFSKLNRFLGGMSCSHMKWNKIVSTRLNSFSSAFEEIITEECCREVLESELAYSQSWFK